MRKTAQILPLLLALWLVVVVCGCGGGGSDTTPVPFPPDNSGNQGGDPNDVDAIPDPPTPFVPPGGAYGDLRGVASSQQYVFVADANRVYAFDKQGALVNTVQALEVVQGIAVFPPSAEIDVQGGDPYLLANCVAVAHNPVTGWGYVTIYPPNLDAGSTRPDAGNPDPLRQDGLPNAVDGIQPPVQVQPPFACLAVYDIAIDRFGTILCQVDLDVPSTPPVPDFPRALHVMNRFTAYDGVVGGSVATTDDQGQPVTIPAPFFHQSLSNAGVGDFDFYNDGNDITPFEPVNLGKIAIDTFYPFNRSDLSYTFYASSANFTRDYVGVGLISLNSNAVVPTYTISQWVNNGFGYSRVIGESGGNAPGSFALSAPLNPNDGSLEDPDITDGGPAGMNVDPLTDQLYVSDPGNRRVEVFARSSGAFLRQIGTGARGSSGPNFLAPSSVALDYEGNVYVCDVNNLRVQQEKLPDRSYGGVGGTVRRLDNHTPIEGATVSLGSELGALAVRATNINGDYIIRNLRTGTYYMTATKFNYDSDESAVQIISDTDVRVDFNLNPRTPPVTGSYVGNLIDGDSNLFLSGVKVQVVGTSIQTVSDSIGHFQLSNLAPGTYQVIFTIDGYATLTRDVEILAGQVTTDNLLEMNRS